MLRYRQPSLSVVWINSINFDGLARVIGLHAGRGFRTSFEGLVAHPTGLIHIGHLSRFHIFLEVGRHPIWSAETLNVIAFAAVPHSEAELSARTTLLLEACPIYEQKRRSVCFVRLSMGKLPVICYLVPDNWKVALDLRGFRGPRSCSGRLFQHAGVSEEELE